MLKNKLNNEFLIRKKKLSQLRKKKLVFSNNFRRHDTADQLYRKYKLKTNVELEVLHIKVSIAGRIIAHRIMGKSSFIKLLDEGGHIQLYFSINSLGSQELYKNIIKQWDIGDIIGAQGVLFRTNSGELSVRCIEMVLLTKSLRPLPDKFHGLVDLETRYRQRYIDLITNDSSRKVFKTRSLIISEIRQFMKENNFLEVETPMMHSIPGGAIARPFITYHNKLKTNMYLRIAPELYLKKLIIGGFEKIFEMNRNFRNESISPYHNPEFTMMEIYMAYSNYLDMMRFVENFLYKLVTRIIGDDNVKYGKFVLNFNLPFSKMSMKESILKYIPEIQSKNIDNIDDIKKTINFFGISMEESWSLEKLYILLFEEVVSKKIIQPTYITHYPISISPLARRSDDNSEFADRFELFIAGQEIGNGFSELNDPEDQKERFLQQVQEKKISDISQDQDNLHHSQSFTDFYDADYLTALEYGLPPTSGVGIGIDRLIMLLTNQHNIRDVILFPTLRAKSCF